ncbi:unnamed protein product [marine sediment metagenome]|uniref:Uncharacterized protein n=1 Tax=marine sediment metagenome TaxID=412755 RepID=X1G3B1_9ZZZZ
MWFSPDTCAFAQGEPDITGACDDCDWKGTCIAKGLIIQEVTYKDGAFIAKIRQNNGRLKSPVDRALTRLLERIGEEEFMIFLSNLMDPRSKGWLMLFIFNRLDNITYADVKEIISTQAFGRIMSNLKEVGLVDVYGDESGDYRLKHWVLVE